MIKFLRFLALFALLSGLIPHAASATLLLHRFIVHNNTSHCFTMTVQQRDQKMPATFDGVRPGKTFDQTVRFDRSDHDWFLEWTIWKCDDRGGLIAPLYSAFTVDQVPYSISEYDVMPLGSGYQMKPRN